MGSELIALRGVTKQFAGRIILDAVDLNIGRGEYVSVTGASGAGKSTLLNILGGLDLDYMGDYYYEGERLQPARFDGFRNREVGFLFQAFNLLPELTARENVLLPYAFHRGKIPGLDDRVEQLFRQFGLQGIEGQRASTLSGGEKQRVALLRSILLEPKILLADEPTGNLDPGNAELVRDFLRQEHDGGKTVITVTHDPAFAMEAERRLCVRGGRIYEES